MTATARKISPKTETSRYSVVVEPSRWTRVMHDWPAVVLAIAGVVTIAWTMALAWGVERMIGSLF